MIQRKEIRRLMPLEKMLLFCGIMAGLMAGLGAAQENASDDYVCTGAEMGSYANLVFCLPPDVVVEPKSMAHINYSNGSEVAASMLLDGSSVELHLLYPCQAPQEELEPAGLKPYLEGYDPIFAQATYNESVTSPILVGQLANLKFIANQRNQTIFLVVADMNMSDTTWQSFLENLRISLIEGEAPASNCADTTGTTATTIEQAAPAQDTETAETITNETTTVQTPAEKIVTGKEKMISDMEAAQARMAELMKNR